MSRSVTQFKAKLGLLIALYMAFAVSYSLVVPVGRGADEWAHYWYAQFIAQNGRLPASPAEREIAGYKSDWPPLYHLLAAGLTGWIDTSGPPTFKYRVDDLRRQLVAAQGPEAILHTEDELWPWQQEILVWHLGRFLSIVFSAGTLLVTYRVALEVFRPDCDRSPDRAAGPSAGEKITCHSEAKPKNLRTASIRRPFAAAQGDMTEPMIRVETLAFHPKSLALLATAVLAFTPRFLFTSMLFNYDSLTLLLSSLFLLLALRIAKGYHQQWGFVGLGALAGLALVTKYLAAPLVLVIVALAFWQAAAQGCKGAKGQKHSNIRFTPYALRTTRFIVRPLLHATLPFLLLITPWFAYLIRTFNEIDRYGPMLGTLAPLLRGDGSDRTVEALFAWLSGGQVPAPAHLERQSYTLWYIVGELPLTFWGNPIVRPYPLTWFVLVMTGLTLLAGLGLWFVLRRPAAGSATRRLLILLLLTCALPLPFMLIRLFGARDALEAMQGRHILFLAGPAFATLFVWGLSFVICHLSLVIGHWSLADDRLPLALSQILRFTFYVLLPLLLTASTAQLLFMQRNYPPLLPVRTTPLTVRLTPPAALVSLPGGSRLLGYQLEDESRVALRVSLWWQAGDNYAPEDYQLELNLLDQAGHVAANWLGYQTQARYPTRAWEPGDTVRDDGWLPLVGLPPGLYTLRWRLFGQTGELLPWQSLASYQLDQPVPLPASASPWVLWTNGRPTSAPPLLYERQTVQFTSSNLPTFQPSNLRLSGPDRLPRPAISTGSTWANVIIGPDWPPGDYRLSDDGPVALRVADNGRSFSLPEIWQPLDVNFAGQIKLLGYNLPSRRAQAGDGFPITLFWQGLDEMGREFVIFTRLLDNRQVVWGGYDRLARENYSTLLWAPGEIISDGFAVPVAADAPDGVYWLNLGWYAKADAQARSLPILDAETGQPLNLTSVMIGPLKVGGPPPGLTVPRANPQIPVEVTWADKIRLIGFDGPAEGARLPASASLELTLFWETLASPGRDYTAFIHVRNTEGAVVAQQDQQPTKGAYPTGLWEAGEIIEDQVHLPLAGLAPGRYEVVIGMYDVATGERLPIAGLTDGALELISFELAGGAKGK